MTCPARRFGVGFLWVSLLAVRSAADEGMWLINQPPVEVLKQRYQFEPMPAWLEHLQKSCVKMGASGSFVSPNGLVMTNHHVGSDQLEKLSSPPRDLLKDGFYARTPTEELKCPDYELKALWSIEDVTQRIHAATKPQMSAAEASAARRKRMSEIEQEAAATGLDCEVVTLYHGARYHVYGYRRYTDVRLVFAPEAQAAAFGGDTDNFEYPRYALDLCFFRVYENDKPLRVEHYLKWSTAGAAEGDLALVCGHPARTNRLFTVDHLKFLRDVELPFSLERLRRREVELLGFVNRSDENARLAGGDLHGVQNGRKARTGYLAALQDPALMKRRSDAERDLRAWVASQSGALAESAGAWEAISQTRSAARERFVRYELLNGRDPLGGSDLFRIARHLVRLARELGKPSADRLREYRETELESVYQRLFSPAPIHDVLEADRLASGLSFLAENLGGDDPLVTRALAGQSPAERAAALVVGTKLKDVAARKALTTRDAAAVTGWDDPMLRLAADLDDESLALRKWYEDEIEGVERSAYAKIAAAQFARSGDAIYPDATGTLRLSFGTIKGYREDGRDTPAFTKIAGLFERNELKRRTPPFNLAPTWSAARGKLALDTPFNFVCTADIIGGNSGSPVVNRAGEVIGLIFDGNIPSLAWGTEYSDTQARAVALDSRAILEALWTVYNARELADEVVGK